MAHTYTSDVQILIQFAKDQGWDLLDVVEAFGRLEAALEKGISDYSIPEDKRHNVQKLSGTPAARVGLRQPVSGLAFALASGA